VCSSDLKDAAVPVAHEEVKALDDYGKILSLLKSVSTEPGGQVVAIFTEAEQIDYTYEAKEAKDSPDVLKRILSDIVQTGAKRHKAIKGTEEKGAT
jgi:gamma-glutamylcysteine synthetase